MVAIDNRKTLRVGRDKPKLPTVANASAVQ